MIAPDFFSTLRYQERADPATLLSDLAQLRRRSADAASRRKLWWLLLVLWIIGCVIGAIIAHAQAGVLATILCGIIGVVVAGVRIYQLGKRILDARRLQLAASLVRALGCDLPADGKLELDVLFADYCDVKYQTGHNPAVGRYRLKSYCLPWLSATGKLADGSQVQLAAEMIVHRKERDKTKGRKKVKEDVHEQISLSLRVPSLPESALAKWPELMRSSRLSHQTHVHRAEAKNGRLQAVVRTHRAVRITNKGTVEVGSDLETKLASKDCLLKALLAAYQALAACKKGG